MSFASRCMLRVTTAALAPSVHAAPLSVPEFAPNPGVRGISAGTHFQPPPSGAGPVSQDQAFPRVTNEEFRRPDADP